MLPLLSHQQTLEPVYLAYLDALEQSAYAGDIDKRYSARLVQATDNSVYQFCPRRCFILSIKRYSNRLVAGGKSRICGCDF